MIYMIYSLERCFHSVAQDDDFGFSFVNQSC